MDPIARARLNSNLLETLAELLSRRVRDPRTQAATLTGVEVSKDGSVAKVFYSVLGDAAERQVTQKGLDNVSGFLRGEVGRLLRLRTTPQLRFMFDESLARGARLESVFRELRESPEETPEGEPGEETDA